MARSAASLAGLRLRLLKISSIRITELGGVGNSVVHQYAVAEAQLFVGRHRHRLVEQKGRVEVMADARAAVPRRGMPRVLGMIEHRNAPGELLAAVELAGQVAPVGDFGRGPVAGGAIGK